MTTACLKVLHFIWTEGNRTITYTVRSFTQVSDADNIRTDLISKKAEENFYKRAKCNISKMSHSADLSFSLSNLPVLEGSLVVVPNM